MKKIILVSILSLLILVSGCLSVTSVAPKNGDLKLFITDKPVNTLDHAYLTIKEVQVLDAENKEWITVNDFKKDNNGEVKVDLLDLRFEEKLLGEKKLDIGEHTKIKLRLSGENNFNVDEVDNDSYLEYYNGTEDNLYIPSEDKEIILDYGFLVEKNKINSLTLDVNLDKILHSSGESESAILDKNYISIIDNLNTGKLKGRVFADINNNGKFDENLDGEPDELFKDRKYDIVIELLKDNQIVKSTVATNKRLNVNNETIEIGNYLIKGIKTGEYKVNIKVIDENNEILTNQYNEPLYELNKEIKVKINKQETTKQILKLNKN